MISCNLSGNVCFKDQLNHYKYFYIKEGQVKHDTYFVLDGSSYQEYINGRLYSDATINWKSCDTYSLIVQKMYDKDDVGIGEGDTVDVKIKSVKKDTVTCITSASSFSAEIRFLRDSKVYH